MSSVKRSSPVRPSVFAAAAEQIADAFPPERLHPAVMAWAIAPERVRSRQRWAVGFSGGADSLALLLWLWARFPGRRGRLVALHFNHRLRGREATADERFCARVCAALGVALIRGAWTEGKPARKAGVSEAEARAARLAFFQSERSARILWLGHQQDDIAETMLMRLARGSGSGGLAAPRPVQPMPGGRLHLRPLLTLKKAEIMAALRAAGVTWREDSTNAGDDFFRNRIRRQVLPAWAEAAQRDALAGAARARELLEEDDAALDAWLAELAPLMPDHALNLKKLAGKPRALLRRALHRWLLAQDVKIDLSRQGFERLLAAIEDGVTTRQSLGPSGFAVTSRSVLRYMCPGKTK